VWCLGLVAAGSCAVFPDQATLPERAVVGGTAGSAGEAFAAQAGTGGHGGSDVTSGGAAGAGGLTGAGGVDTPVGGAGGQAPCLNPQQQVVAVTADTWIESARPGTGHGNDVVLSVVGGTNERRALLALTLPAVPSGAILRKATFALHLQANADASLVARRFGLRRLTRDLNEARATWNNYSNGAVRKWTTPGGDFGVELSSASVRAETSNGALTFDVTEPIRTALGAQAVLLSVIVLETGPIPAPPAELAFTSREGDASGMPALILEYCQP
jgi:hypothetical protein